MEIPARCVCLREKMCIYLQREADVFDLLMVMIPRQYYFSSPPGAIRLPPPPSIFSLLDGDNKTVSLPGIYLIYGLHYWIPVPVWQRRGEERRGEE